jgi:hypothetical protein
MKKKVIFLAVAFNLIFITITNAQEQDSITQHKWSHKLAGNFYIIPDDFFILPVYQGDLDRFHMEMRYNYEDRQTFSIWFGYNFSGGNSFEYNITPMAGAAIGNTNGLAPGLEITLGFYGFELYTESEYIFDLDAREDNFYYNWTDLSYSPTDWLWFGLSIQRTKLYQTDLEIQRGLLLGGGYKWFGINGYLYNIGWDDPYFILSLSLNF